MLRNIMEYPLVKIAYINHKAAPILFTTLNLFPSITNDARINAVAINPIYSTDSIISITKKKIEPYHPIHLPIRYQLSHKLLFRELYHCSGLHHWQR